MNKHGLSFSTFVVLLIVLCCVPRTLESRNSSDLLPDSLRYFAQTPPGSTPIKFAPGLVSLSGRPEVQITFSPDGRSAFFFINFWPNSGTPYCMYSEVRNGIWSFPDTASFSKGRNAEEPSFSPDGSRVTLNSNRSLNQVGAVDLSYVVKTDSLWSDPISLGNPPNSERYQYHSCVVADSSIYFSANNGDICRCQYSNGTYLPRTILPFPVNFANTTQTWGDPYVSPGEDYLIFKSTRLGGYGANDIYISYRTTVGGWTNPKNIGGKINTASDEYSGDVTPDGKYMTFGRDGDIYWVSTSFIDSLRHTNFVPYLKTRIANQTDTIWHPFSYTVPDTVFIDDDGNETLMFSIAMSNGDQLPAWLQFDPLTRTITGVPIKTGSFSLTMTATDTAGAAAACTFMLTVKPGHSIDYLGQIPPGDSAKIFIPGTVSQPGRLEHAGVFSRDGHEFYFSVVTNNWSTLNTFMRKYIGGTWTPEEPAPFSSLPGGAAEVFINGQNSYAMFVSRGNASTTDGWLKTDFWTVKRTGTGWGTPRKLDAAINDIEVQWHPSISDSGHIYFGSKGSIFVADRFDDTTYGVPEKLADGGINRADAMNAEPCISKDERSLIFSSNRSGGYGNNDLYISFRKNDGTWTEPANLGPRINSTASDFSPSITPDGNYLLFTRDDGSTRHIYWVGTGFIDSIRRVVSGIPIKKALIPGEYHLLQNYPNPFNPSTVISFSLPFTSFVSLKIYEMTGKEVATLVSGELVQGTYSRQWTAEGVSSGIYLYRITATPRGAREKPGGETGVFTETKKLVLLK